MRFPILTLILAVFAGCATTPPSRLEPDTAPPLVTMTAFADSRHFIIEREVVYRIAGSDQTITVPAGFVTDFASTPRALWSFGLAPHGQYSRAALLHDYLYWSQSCTQAQSDKLFLQVMKQSGVSPASQMTIYRGVRLAGDRGWHRNAAARAAGFVRVIPEDRREIPVTATWPVYRQHLRDTGVRPPPEQQAALYCALAEDVGVS